MDCVNVDPSLQTQTNTPTTSTPSAHPSTPAVEIQDTKTGPKKTSKNKNWAPYEDVQLCKSWAGTSLDPIEGDSQKKATYWARIHSDFVTGIKDTTKTETDRSQSAVERRFGIIQHDVNKFCAAYDQATSSHYTGRVQLDLLEIAHQIFAASNEDKRFTLEHCWAILRNYSKWSDYRDQLSKKAKDKKTPSKKSRATSVKANEAGSTGLKVKAENDLAPEVKTPTPGSKIVIDTSDDESSTPKRPPGRRASKKKKIESDQDGHAKDVGADLAAAHAAMAQAAKRKARSSEIAIEEARQAANDKIMLQPIDTLDDETKAYMIIRRRQILQRLEEDAQKAGLIQSTTSVEPENKAPDDCL